MDKKTKRYTVGYKRTIYYLSFLCYALKTVVIFVIAAMILNEDSSEKGTTTEARNGFRIKP